MGLYAAALGVASGRLYRPALHEEGEPVRAAPSALGGSPHSDGADGAPTVCAPGKHAHYATALSNLGVALEQHGLHGEARKHLKRALGINKRALGEEHASTKDTATSLERAERASKRAVG